MINLNFCVIGTLPFDTKDIVCDLCKSPLLLEHSKNEVSENTFSGIFTGKRSFVILNSGFE